MEWLAWIIGIAIAWKVVATYFAEKRRKERIAFLMSKYGDEKIVDMIMERTMWQGQTEEQLRDSLGNPAAMDASVLKTKTKDVWKYHREGRNRFALRVIVENGLVVGWKQKGD